MSSGKKIRPGRFGNSSTSLTMKMLVTGDRGYIGSTLVDLLNKEKYQVVGLDTDFFRSTIGPSIISSSYQKITKDIRDVNEKDTEGIDAVIHLCALSNDPLGELNPRLTEEINFSSSVRLARLAKKMGVKRFIFSSSCSVYGVSKNGLADEDSRTNPLTAYAKSKIDAEKELLKMADNDFCVCVLRSPTVYGYSPKFRNDLVVNNLTTTGLIHNQIRIASDGTPWRPLIDVRDLSSIFIEFLKVKKEAVNSKIINVGFDENNFQIKDLVEIVKNVLFNCNIAYTGEHGKDTRSYKVSFNKFKKIFPNIKQKWTLEKSVKDLVEKLKRAQFGKKEFRESDFSRLNILKKLIESKLLDFKLYWVNK